jgi:hypothetical protein
MVDGQIVVVSTSVSTAPLYFEQVFVGDVRVCPPPGSSRLLTFEEKARGVSIGWLVGRYVVLSHSIPRPEAKLESCNFLFMGGYLETALSTVNSNRVVRPVSIFHVRVHT